MDSTKPFIHLLETPYGKYFFDVNTDRIYKVEESIYYALKLLIEGKQESICKETAEKIENMKEEGLLKTNRPKTMKHPATDYMDYYLKHKLRGITLQVTQNCNFRCEYCVYGQDSTLNRSHSINKMSIETAKKAVDFLRERSRDTEEPNIGFYGGEPLLEFDLIKQVVHYTKDIFFGKPITFNMTSNASLINQEIMDFLSLHSIRLMISLDGPKEIHDNKRKFAANGCGTFDKVMEKLQFIKLNYPQYYQDNISFSTVIDPSKEFDCINEMSFRYDLLSDTRIMATLIDDTYSKEKNNYSDEYIEQSRYEEFKTFLNEIGKIRLESLSAISRQRTEGEKTFLKTVGTNKIYDEMSHGGPCVIGERRLFSDVDGNLFPCERVSESSSVMSIGNIKTGFEMKKIDNLINIARLTKDSCHDCWAINRCMICARYADDGQKLCAENILRRCAESISSVEYQISRYLAVKELQMRGNI